MKRLLWIVGLLLSATTAYGQSTQIARVVGTCGTASLVAGVLTYATIDPTGNVCVSATFSGSVSGNSAASATGSMVPANADYQGLNVGGTLRGATGLALGATFSQTMAIVDSSGNQISSFGGGTQYTQDAALTVATTIGTMAMGRASAAVPTDVSADNDAVMPWYLRSGAQAVQLTNAGVLTLSGSGTATGALRVELPTNGTGVIASITNAVGTTAALNAIADGAIVTLGAKADNKSTATDGTAITLMQIAKEISFMEQNPASRAVTNAGTFPTQSAITAAANSIASGAYASGAYASGAIAVGAIVSGADVAEGTTIDDRCTTTNTTACTMIGLAKQINFLLGTPTGQQTKSNSNSFTLASDQGAVASPLFVTVTPSTSGGWSVFNATAADGATACTSTAQAVKASAGTFGGYFINNPNTADSWVQVWNLGTGSITVGTTAPTMTFRIPGAAANSVGANLELANGIQFGTAISIACTSTAGGNGAPSAALEADIFYK